MADTRKITIELTTSGANVDEDENENKSEESQQKKKSAAVKTMVKQSLSWAYQEISAQVTYNIGNYMSLSEDYKSQVALRNITTTVNKVTGMASNIISWATTGSAAGVGGAVAGAVLGAVTYAGSTTLDLLRQYNSQDMSLKTNDAYSYYAQSRLGLIDNGRGTQN